MNAYSSRAIPLQSNGSVASNEPVTENSVTYPPEASAILDVTKAPYFADSTGQKDCTAILIGVLDEIARHSMMGMEKVVDILEREASPNFRLHNSFENRKTDGVVFGVFPYTLPPSKIIYFPKGTYLVSDTVSYSFDNLRNALGAELNWCIRFQGESRTDTVIRLRDNCKGFEYGMARPVITFIRGSSSNVAMSNYFRNLTIDTGRGNPGAIGLEFFGNNSAAVRNVTIRSGDPEGRGMAGISVSRRDASGCVFKNIAIHGFDHGLLLHAKESYLVCENIDLYHQRAAGVSVDGPIVSIRNVQSRNRFPALSVKGHQTHVVMLDSDLREGAPDAPGIEYYTGQLFVRNVRTQDYRCGVGMRYVAGWGTDPLVPDSYVREYTSHSPVVLSEGQPTRSLGLEIEDAPEIPWEADFDRWTHPGEYGAVGDGLTDDTIAIQRAMDSGKPIVFFQPGQYLINAPVRIPASVRRINFMFVDLISGTQLQEMKDRGMFVVSEESPQPLLMEDLFSFEMNYGFHYLVEHASRRTLVLRDLHSQSCAAYRNSVPGGTVFLENVVTTTGIYNDTYQQPCFSFTGQKAWCRQIDPEYTPDKIINDGGFLFVMGFKTEGEGIAFTTKHGGRTEVLGGILYFGANNDVPAVLNDRSDVAFVASTTGSYSHHLFKTAVRETDEGGNREALHSLFPLRYGLQYAIPLYVGRRRNGSLRRSQN